MSFSNNEHISDAHFWSMLCFFIICVLVDGFNFISALGTVVKVVLSVPEKILSVSISQLSSSPPYFFKLTCDWTQFLLRPHFVSLSLSSSLLAPWRRCFQYSYHCYMVHMFIVLQQSKSIHNNFTFLTKTTTTAILTQPIAEDRIAIADVFATQRC